MSIYEHRRTRLLEVMRADFKASHNRGGDSSEKGMRVAFCNKTGLSESRLAQLLSTTYRNGTAFTEKTARKVESLAGLPEMYLDQDMAMPEPLPRQARQPGTQGAVMTLAYPAELELLDLWRRADVKGRVRILRVARDEVEEAMPATDGKLQTSSRVQ